MMLRSRGFSKRFRSSSNTVHGQSGKGSGLGADLLTPAAGKRALSVAVEIGEAAIAIDAQNERAEPWYAQYGGARLLDPMNLILLSKQSLIPSPWHREIV